MEPILEKYTNAIPKPGAIDKLIPGWEGRYQKSLQEAKTRFEGHKAQYDKATKERDVKIKMLQHAYNKDKEIFDARVAERNREVDELEKAYQAGDPDTVCTYNTIHLLL